MDTQAELPNAVLVIEDSPIQARIISTRIQDATALPVLVAHSVQEAEQLLQERANDIFVAVTGLNLEDGPDGEAVDLCLRWHVPSIVLTASLSEQMRARCIERNVVDYFFKGTITDMEPLITSLERTYKNQAVTALVVDDSRTQRGLLRRLLEVQRITVCEAGCGEEALEMLGKRPEIRLVITDFNMPGMGGLELVRHIRASHPLTRVAVIGVSAVGSGSLTAQFLKYGATDFLNKPFEVEEFYWRVNQTLSTQDLLRELKERQS